MQSSVVHRALPPRGVAGPAQRLGLFTVHTWSPVLCEMKRRESYVRSWCWCCSTHFALICISLTITPSLISPSPFLLPASSRALSSYPPNRSRCGCLCKPKSSTSVSPSPSRCSTPSQSLQRPEQHPSSATQTVDTKYLVAAVAAVGSTAERRCTVGGRLQRRDLLFYR